METVVVAVGSRRQPKLNAVSETLRTVGPMLEQGVEFRIVGEEVPTGVGHTPLNRTELMAGARGRVEALARVVRERREPWRYFVGLEGGLDVVQENGRRLVFLESWAFVSDGAGREAYGRSGGVLLPEPLAVEVVDRGVELSAAIDTYAGGQGIRDAQGAWGVLTQNLITREESLRIALIAAFAPFFNPTLYCSR
jgi:inosine/xanthosine triphosphatase